MIDVLSRQGLAELKDAAHAAVPSPAFGLSLRLDEEHDTVLHLYLHGFGEFAVPRDTMPEALRSSAAGVQRADGSVLRQRPHEAMQWMLTAGKVEHIVSVPVVGSAPAARMWVGTFAPDAPTDDQVDRLARVAGQGLARISRPLSPDELAERIKRLELAADLLPALLRVLDVRDVFESLSATARRALPHDLLLLRLMNEDLTVSRIYAHSDRGAEVGAEQPARYPPAVSNAWLYDIIDDHAVHFVEAGDALKHGARSSLRVPIRFDDRVIGGLSFISKQPSQYTITDVAVGRRLADHVAAALSHHLLAARLTEEARQKEILKARETNLSLLEQLLETLTGTGTVHDAFERSCAIATKVLAHDAALLLLRLADGVHARVYASSGFPAAIPEITEVPPELLKNPGWQHDIFDDLEAAPDPRHQRIAGMGFRSMLRVPILLDGKFSGALIFLSRSQAAFSQPDTLVARRLCDRLQVALAHERELDAARRADEAGSRASALEARVQNLVDELDAKSGGHRVIGNAPAWRQALTQATQVAATDTTVLLLGESGTGKEVLARFVHRGSKRKGGPFIALNCAALPEQLLEAELFGYERGAFTGATLSKPGQLELASGGTLFLDEVGEMSRSAQAKFLRVLQEREFQRLGGTRVLKTDARIVAATNRDLPAAIGRGHFREDLYYRLNVFAINLPPLRDRKEDVLPLSAAFLEEIGRTIGRPPGGISRDARDKLVEYHWPGNVRELRNILERAAILCDGGLITADHLALHAGSPMVAMRVAAVATPAAPSPRSSDVPTMERSMIEQALQDARFNKSRAAKALGLTRHQLYVRMRKYGLE